MSANRRLAPKFGTNVAGPGDEDDIIGYSKQIQLTIMRVSGAPRQSPSKPCPPPQHNTYSL